MPRAPRRAACVWVALAVIMGCADFVRGAGMICTGGPVYPLSTDGGATAHVADGDAGGHGTYGSAGNCQTWVVTSSNPAATLRLVVNDFNLGLNADRLDIFDGASTSAPHLGVLVGCGPYYWPRTEYSTGSALTFVLSLDNFEHTGGFKIDVDEQPLPVYCTEGMIINTSSDPRSPVAFFNPADSYYNVGPYRAGVNCSWLVNLDHSQASMTIDLDICREDLMFGDYVEVYDGPTMDAPLLGRRGAGQVTGGAHFGGEPTFVPTARQTLIRFVSQPGAKLFFKGFEVIVRTWEQPLHCSGRAILNATATQNGQAIVEPYDVIRWDNAGGYLPGHACEWLVQAPPGKTVMYGTSRLEINPGDLLIVYAGADRSAPSRRFNKEDIYSPAYATNTSVALFTFESMVDVRPGKGFVVYYWYDTMLTQCTADAPRLIVDGAVNQTLYPGYTLSAPTPVGFPTYSRYSAGQTCRWMIQSDDGNDIVLSFSGTGDGRNSLYLNRGDSLIIYTLDDVTNATTVVRNISGTGAEIPADSPARWPLNLSPKRALVEFVAGTTGGEGTGFSLSFNFFTPVVATCPASVVQVYPPYTNYLVRTVPASNFGRQFYAAGLNCQWLINATNPTTGARPDPYASITFPSISLRDGDVLRLYDGSTTGSPLLAAFTGTVSIEQDVYASGGLMLVTFTSQAGGAAIHQYGFISTASLSSDNSGYTSLYTGYCATQGSHTMGINDAAIFVQTGSTGNPERFPRNVTCIWRFHRSDWNSSAPVGFLIERNECTQNMGQDNSIIIYDGATTSAPIIYSNAYGVQSFVSNAYKLGSTSADLLVVFHSGMIYKDNNGAVIKISAFFGDDGHPLPNFCGGLQTRTLSEGTVLPFAKSGNVNFMIPQNMHCQWLVQATTTTTIPAPIIQIYRALWNGVYDGDDFPSEYNLTVYDGPSNLFPVLWSRVTGGDVVFSSGPQVFLEFDAINAQMHPQTGLMLNMKEQNAPTLCAGHVMVRWQDEFFISSSRDWDGAASLPQPRTCTWTLQTDTGAVWVLQDFSSELQEHESVTLHDGPDSSAPVLAVIDHCSRLNVAYATTGQFLHVAYATARTDVSHGFEVRALAAIPPRDICDTWTDPNTITILHSGFLGVFGNGQEAVFPGRNFGITQEFLMHAFPPKAPSSCQHTFQIPFGYYLDTIFDYNLVHGTIDVLRNGQYIASVTGIQENVDKRFYDELCGLVTIRINISAATAATYWRLQANLYSFDGVDYGEGPIAIPDYCRPADEVICYKEVTAASQADTMPYQGCTLITKLTLTAADNFTMNRLKHVRQQLIVGGDYNHWSDTATGQVSMPALVDVRSLFISYVHINGSFSAPSMTSALEIWAVLMSGEALEFPQLQVLKDVYIHDTDLKALNFPRLTQIRNRMLVDVNNVLLMSNLTSLVSVLDLRHEFNSKLARVPTPALQSFSSFSLISTLVDQVVMPAATRDVGDIILTDSILISDIYLPNVTSIRSLSVTNGLQLFRITVPRLLSVHTDLCLKNTHVDTLEARELLSVNSLSLSLAAYLTTVVMPKLGLTKSIALADSVIQSVSLPSLSIIQNSITFTNNYKLSVLDFCALNETSDVTLTNCPLLSCQETRQLFRPSGSVNIDAIAPNCDSELLGSFGCTLDVVQRVNTSRCGFTLACIQHSIDASYYDKRGVVELPSGVYTGCGTPLNPRSKRIVFRSEYGGSSTIDCQGVGQAMVINQGETSQFQVQDIHFKNGQGVSGGLVQISGASPVFRRVTFTGGAAVTGGAVYASGSAAPAFVDCVFSASLAENGGALALVESSSTISHCIFDANSATDQAGAVLILSATSAVSIDTSSFHSNAAEQGGAVFTDSALVVTRSNFTANLAGQFAGALACVPVDAASGTWVNVSDTSFADNLATTGGAIYAFSANLHVSNATLSGNHVIEDGGAISALCSPSYRILRGIKTTCAQTVLLEASLVFNNSAGGNGGGIIVEQAKLVATGGVWSANEAEGSGGALYSTASMMTLSGVTVSHNAAKNVGGGLYCEPYTGACEVRSSVLSSNSATVAGGGVYMCTSNCPNTTRASKFGALPAPIQPPDLASTARGNVFAANEVDVGGYGGDVGSDPAMLLWETAPTTSIVSGRSVSDSGSLSVRVIDSFASVVTTSPSVLALSLSVRDLAGNTIASQVAVTGSNTAIAENGIATFSQPTFVASSIATANRTMLVVVRLSDTVAIQQQVALMPCAAGQGRVVDAPVVCIECLPGTAGSADTNYVCLSCDPGSAAPTAAQSSCARCPIDTYAPLTGSSTCLPCAEHTRAASEGSVECVADVVDTKATNVLVPAVSASVGALLLIILGGILLWRLARRKTMQRYYLDDDTTIRAGGDDETPLMRSVKKILGASSTSRVGGGMFADVFKAKHENKWIALKVMRKEEIGNSAAQMEFRREAVALSRLMEKKCYGIVELAFFLERNPMCVAMEFCSNGTLKHLLPRRALSLADKIRIAAEASAAMVVVHACNIVHLDLKTDNLLLDEEMHVKLADFGISRILDARGAASLSGLESVASNPIFGAHSNPAFQGDPAHLRRDSNAPTMGRRESNFGASQDGGAGVGMDVIGGSNGVGGGASDHGSVSLGSFGPGTSEAFTPQYVDPLRIVDLSNQGDDFLRSSDVYSFGVVLWAIYSQEEPYAGISAGTLMTQLRGNPLMRPKDVPNMHLEYERIMRACWHADPTARPAFIEVRRRLGELLRAESGGEELRAGYIVAGDGNNYAVGTGPNPDGGATHGLDTMEHAATYRANNTITPAAPPPGNHDQNNARATVMIDTVAPPPPSAFNTMPPPPPGPPPPATQHVMSRGSGAPPQGTDTMLDTGGSLGTPPRI